MKRIVNRFHVVLSLFITSVIFSAFVQFSASSKIAMPYKKAGLTDEQAAAHLLSRFTFGAEPNQVEEVVKKGLNKWIKEQLDADLKDDELDEMLKNYDALNLSNVQVEDLFPRSPTVRRMAIKDGYLNKDSVNTENKRTERLAVEKYMKDKGIRPQQELFRQLFSQKILRASYAKNQLQEVMTDFWFNHFNVAIIKPICANFIPAYERDVIRPNVFGDFEDLVLKTAKSPAMLLYLDNFTSTGQYNPIENQQADLRFNTNMKPEQRKRMNERLAQLQKSQQDKKGKSGLNENYAREVMELHTLGVDGGYTQSDVTQAARVLTGWTIAPMGDRGVGSGSKNLINRIGIDKLNEKGYVLDGDFFFAMSKHDNGEKVVLGKKFPAGGGYEEGVELLRMLAHHPSCAKFIAKKLAVRFVSDNPPQSLIDKMAKTFTEKNGNIKEVLITLVNSPEFWSKDSLRDKTKSPFELAISAVRSVDAKIAQPYQLYTWINKMGQQLYFYQAPTGFPDNGQYWINTGSLLNRMNFGLAFASQKIPGVSLDLSALNNHKEPESIEAALMTYSQIILPQRDVTETIDRLKPMLNDANLQKKVSSAAAKNDLSKPMIVEDQGMNKKEMNKKQIKDPQVQYQQGNSTMLAQVVGVILGSPEFQRR